MFQSIGAIEIAIIGVIVIVLFGGKRLADFIRGIGGGVESYRDSKKDSEE